MYLYGEKVKAFLQKWARRDRGGRVSRGENGLGEALCEAELSVYRMDLYGSIIG